MKITAIQTKSFLGARDVDLKLTKPVCLVAGPNGSGKSSLHEAVRQALTGESVRVALKKDYQKLITEGEKVGYAVVEHDGERSAITLPNGTHEHTGSRPPAAVSFCLDAQRFAAKLDANERRQFLFGLMDLQTDGPAVTDRLAAKGCDPAKIERIAPFLRSGFDAASKEALAKAREAKAVWRTITGEAYGSTKAVAWRAQKPPVDATRLAQARTELSALGQEIETASVFLGEIQGRSNAAAAQAARIAGLRQKASLYARVADKLARDQAELKQWEAKVTALRGSLKSQEAIPCPDCGVMLVMTDGALVPAAPMATGTEDDLARLPDYERALELMQRSVANGLRDLGAADAAAKQIEEEEKAGVEAPDEEEIKTLRLRIDDLKKQREQLHAVIRGLEDAERMASDAGSQTERAAVLHKDIQQWDQIGSALAPDGIPGELLAEALGPINARLERSSCAADWLRVVIAADMTITADGGRPYTLLSESEKWRADAMIAEAIAHLSGVRFLTLDRFDVLDLKGREDLLYWLDELADNGDIDTALVTGTLKGLPARLPERIEAHWIENGLVGKIREAA
ncbi:MAG: AAA family ATPase [Accumulibacter sp.]|jgi:energy-coupling factor transporter ATP-binding protein EcfA2|uniref:AAA family ATPase n=1 Tax=Accumulibacter sp. TaxID=2053492 RepID=UPI002FC3361F